MVFKELKEFEKDKKKLTKKFKSIPTDIETVKQVLKIFPDARPSFSFEINNLGIESCIIKIKKLACKSLKGKGVNSGLRLVYAHFKNEEVPKDNDHKEEKIVFIEIYHKSDKEMEDRKRILKHFK